MVLASSGTAEGSTTHDIAYGDRSIATVTTGYEAVRSTSVVVGDGELAEVCAAVEGLLPQPLIVTIDIQTTS